MVYGLHNLQTPRRDRRALRRLGRGHGSGRGKTAGRGTKGQKARTGGRGGLKRLGMKRILLAAPKVRGFRSLRPKPVAVNIGVIERAFTAGATITPRALVSARLIRSKDNGVKVLGGGSITKPFTFKCLEISAPAREKITAAGGSIEPQAVSRKP